MERGRNKNQIKIIEKLTKDAKESGFDFVCLKCGCSWFCVKGNCPVCGSGLIIKNNV